MPEWGNSILPGGLPHSGEPFMFALGQVIDHKVIEDDLHIRACSHSYRCPNVQPGSSIYKCAVGAGPELYTVQINGDQAAQSLYPQQVVLGSRVHIRRLSSSAC